MVDRGQLELRQLTTRLLASRDRPKRQWLIQRIGHLWSVPKRRLRRIVAAAHEKNWVHADPTPESVAAVLSFTSDENVNVRVATTFALRQRQVPDELVATQLAQMLADQHPIVRVNAAHALSHDARNAMTEKQIKAALGNETWSVRWVIAESLAESKHSDIAWHSFRHSLPRGNMISFWLYHCRPFADRLSNDESLKSTVAERIDALTDDYMVRDCKQTFARLAAPKSSA